MRNSTYFTLLEATLAAPALNMQEAMILIIEKKARLTKSSTDGKESHPIIKAHGSGITDGQ